MRHVHITLTLVCELSPVYCWLQLIVDNRPHEKNLDSLTINDIQNGVYVHDTLHNHFLDPRDVVVLKVRPPFSSE